MAPRSKRSYSLSPRASTFSAASVCNLPCSTPRNCWQQQGELTLTPGIRAALARISPATLDRLYQRQPELPRRRLTRSRPRRPSEISRLVPMQIIPWEMQEPGHLEIDLVHHSGPDPSGDFLYTLHWLDVATGWSERYPILGRSGMVMHDACAVLWSRLPFPLREIHIDNGSEFLNDHLLRFFQKQDPTVCFSRNRPWCKNDSRFVEQKNYTLVREYLRYGRMDTPGSCPGARCPLRQDAALLQSLPAGDAHDREGTDRGSRRSSPLPPAV